MASGGPPAAQAAKRATSRIPIVFASGDDPVATGLVASLARPGGNLTGVSFRVADLNPKRLELLSELVPQAKVIALLVNPKFPETERVMREVQEAARAKGLQLPILKASNESEIDAALYPSPNCKPVRSSSGVMRSSTAGASSSWHWQRAMPFQRFMSCVSPSFPAA